MLVSIVIPVYNVAPYIEQCIQSVINQTYKNLEIIIVDDCGTDNSIEIVEKVISQVTQNSQMSFKILHHDHNSGLSAARNTGINAATGDYLYFIDSDDWIFPECIELLVKEAQKQTDVDVVMGNTINEIGINDFGINKCAINKFKDSQYLLDKKWLQYQILTYGLSVTAWNRLLRYDFIVENSLYFLPGLIHEDEHWIFYVLKHIRKWSFVFEDTYIHRMREGSIMTTISREATAKNWFKIMLDHSSKFYEPFYTLQLAKYMNMYFNQWMFEYHWPDSSKLHLNFIKACIKKHLWKGASLLTLWALLYKIRDGFRFKMWLMDYSRKLYSEETERMNNYAIL